MAITKEEILGQTNGGWEIFRHLIEGLPAKPGKKFFSVFREEKTASANVFLGEKGIYRYGDFGNAGGLDAINFVMELKKVEFPDALKLCAEYANMPVVSATLVSRKEIVLAPSEALVSSVREDLNTPFHTFCISLGIDIEHLKKWNVGGDGKGKTVFVYQRADTGPCNLKYMAYGKDGKRIRTEIPYSLKSKKEGEKYLMCLYGEHLLSEDKPVCVVESEKTAVIASFFYPQYDWLATGGTFGAQKSDYLRNNLHNGRQILVLVDADPIRKTPKAMEICLQICAKADTVDLFPDRTDKSDIADYIVEGLRPEIVRDPVKVFWDVIPTKNGIKIEVLPIRFGTFLMEHNFMKYYPEGSNFFELCRIEGKFVELTSEKRIQDYVNAYLKNTQPNDVVGNYFARNTNLFKEDFLGVLTPKTFDIQRDTKDTAFVYYQNCVVLVTANGVEQIPYNQIGGYIWKNHVIKRDFVPSTDGIKGEYERFVGFISGGKEGNEVKFDAFRSAIGYMLHEFRNPGKAKAVILNDSNDEQDPKGGAGKGIFCKALSFIRRLTKIDAKQFDPTDTFAYQTVDPTDQIVELSDVDKKIDFTKLFNIITDGFRIRRLYKDPIILPPERSPKIIITTNYGIKGRGGANRRRKYELEFTDYFHEDFTAEDEFGHILFLDWDAKEWQRFDNFMIGCLQFFLKNGLVKDIHKTLAIKTFEANTSPQFREWCEGENSLIQVPGTRNFREDLLSSYLEQNPEHKKWMQWPVMRRYLECYCEYAGMVMKEGNTIKRWCELHVKEGTVRPKELKEEPTTEMEIDEEPPF